VARIFLLGGPGALETEIYRELEPPAGFYFLSTALICICMHPSYVSVCVINGCVLADVLISEAP
jgi:hypothetical protein